VRKLLE
jgi:hypothetical protein